MALHPQQKAQALSLQGPERFWLYQAAQLCWHKPPSAAISAYTKTLENGVTHPIWSWFPDGEVSTCFNCVDRHVHSGRGENNAIIWDSPVTGSKEIVTYQQLLEETETLAGVLREHGVRKGDVVLVYSKYFLSELHSPRKLTTTLVSMIPAAIFAILAISRLGAVHTVVFDETIIWQREQLTWTPLCPRGGELSWQELVADAKRRKRKAGPVSVRSDEPLYILFTSGTTGSPKGVVRDAGGHAVGMKFCMRYVFGISQPGDVVFAASDIGWVLGHCSDVGDDGKLKSLKAIFLAGERSEPSIVWLYESLLGKYCAEPARVVDNWWSTETGSPITGLALGSNSLLDFYGQQFSAPLPIKPGSAGKPMPGYSLRVVDDKGQEVPRGNQGNIVLDLPLGPTASTSLWRDDMRFYNSYMKRFMGKFFDTGDLGFVDENGYIYILSRSDDVINVAAHRLSSAAIEEVILAHPFVAECCVVGMPDPQKGHKPCVFLTLSQPPHLTGVIPYKQLKKELQTAVREHISPIASIGAIIQGQNIIPKTRSGKTMRRVLRDLVENAMRGGINDRLEVPATIEDYTTVTNARSKLGEYLELQRSKRTSRAKL
ncbi:hypothetical protein NPX13_g8831 [Xylaria arbuscula]|uniref:Uncharacterized protein n=1 Tax=Xylaria arbuscula TaxID=114810 RepID=A0A9W8N7X6_9PEZI|nr:hypothetical protein NPX13_g8831 [Xylaria arbuscula]